MAKPITPHAITARRRHLSQIVRRRAAARTSYIRFVTLPNRFAIIRPRNVVAIKTTTATTAGRTTFFNARRRHWANRKTPYYESLRL